MDEEERLRKLEDDFQQTKEELRKILLDIRGFLMEVNTPLRSEFNEERLPGVGFFG
jgi:hypothetical protein